jgi:hypothetical protein
MSQPPLTSDDYERLGRVAENLLVKRYIHFIASTPRQIWLGFIHGFFTGLGGVIGATLGVAILLYLLQQLGALPGIGDFFQNLVDTIKR